jgi:hypothetical protein
MSGSLSSVQAVDFDWDGLFHTFEAFHRCHDRRRDESDEEDEEDEQVCGACPCAYCHHKVKYDTRFGAKWPTKQLAAKELAKLSVVAFAFDAGDLRNKKAKESVREGLRLRLSELANLRVFHMRCSAKTITLDFSSLPSTLRELRLHRCTAGSIPTETHCSWIVNLGTLTKLEVLDLVDAYQAWDKQAPLSLVVRGAIPLTMRELRISSADSRMGLPEDEFLSYDSFFDEFATDEEQDDDEDDEEYYGPRNGRKYVVTLTPGHTALDILELRLAALKLKSGFFAATNLRWLLLQSVFMRDDVEPTISPPKCLRWVCVERTHSMSEAVVAILNEAVKKNTAAPAPPTVGPCTHCAAHAELRCARCGTLYCSLDCQRAAWSTHKHTCKK